MKLLLPIEIETDHDPRLCAGSCPLLNVDDCACRYFGSLAALNDEGDPVEIRAPQCVERAREIVSQETSEWIGEDGATYPVEILAMRRPR